MSDTYRLIERATAWAEEAERKMTADDLAEQGLAYPTACAQLGLLYAQLALLRQYTDNADWQYRPPGDT